MNSSYALNFKNKYRNIDELLAQSKKVGQLVYLRFNDQFIIYLKAKSTYFQNVYKKL